MRCQFIVRSLVALSFCGAALQTAQAQTSLFFGSESMNYSGTWTSFSDPGLSNKTGSGFIPTTNFSGYISVNSTLGIPGPGNTSFFQTVTYVSGAPNFNKVNNFLGVFSPTASSSGGWNGALNQFSIAQKGSTSGDSGSRFDPTNGLYGPLDSKGEWNSYSFAAVVGGITATPNSPSAGVFTADQVIPGTIVGTFNGVFKNAGAGIGSGQYYVVDLGINNAGNGARANGNPADFFGPKDSFSGNFVIPEPASCVTFAMVLAASAGFGWKRRRDRLNCLPSV